MKLEDLGYSPAIEKYRKELGLDTFEVGRVVAEHKERYVVRTVENEFEGEIVGNLRFSAVNRADFPSVGDWVAISEYDDDKVLIHAVYQRKTIIERQAVGKKGEKQIIAANIDYAFIIQAVDMDFNLNRIERYLIICYTAGVTPIILLSKTDLISESELGNLINLVEERIKEVPVLTISNESGAGIKALKDMLEYGKTYCLLGSSGVGKSSLINNLAGKEIMKTSTISSSTHKGRHATTHREMHILENGGILIDNPGMREVGIGNAGEGLEQTFDLINTLSKNCRFKDCTHTVEAGCSVLKAVKGGEIDRDYYDNYLKTEREKEHFESTVAEKRKKDKDFGKMVKQFKSIKKKQR